MANDVEGESIKIASSEFSTALQTALGGSMRECDDNIRVVVQSQEKLGARLDTLVEGELP